jgi:hypothetical protein
MNILGRVKAMLGFRQKVGPAPQTSTGTIDDAVKENKGTYISDAALDNPDDDKFDRKAFAKRIAETVGSKIDPSSIVIGIYGPWGDGKTTVLNFVEKSLGEFESVICFRFNPWRFEDETVLLRTFFESLAQLLKRRLSNNKEEIGKLLCKYGGLLSSGMKAIGSAIETSGVEMSASPVGELGDAVANLGALWSGTPLDELRLRIDEILRVEKKRIVVLMDDIDRLDKSEIHAVLRLVKLTADFKYTAYIMAFDHEMVSAAIGDRYTSDPTGPSAAGASFLEKIVQVPLYLPPIPESALVSFCYECVNEALAESRVELTTAEGEMFVTHFQRAAANRLGTPRVAKRYANALAFSLAMLRGEVHLGELMLVEAMRLFYPELYKATRSNKDLVLGIGRFARSMHNGKEREQSITGLIDRGTKDLSDEQRGQARGLLQTLFPRTSDTTYDSDWEEQWSREKRIAARDYFERYFTYSITSTDVSDKDVQAFVEGAPTLSREQAAERLASLLNPKNAGAVVAKLRQFEKTASPEQATVLARAMSDAAGSLPVLESGDIFTTPFSQAAVFVTNMLRRVPDEPQRRAEGSAIVMQSPSLRFACEVMRFSIAYEKGRSGVFSLEDEKTIKERLASRLLAHLAESVEPIYLAEPTHALTYLQFLEWFGNGKQARQYLRDALTSRPESVFEFLRITAPQAWSGTTGLPVEVEFLREQYNLVAKLVDATTVADILRDKFGSALDKPEFRSNQGRDRNEALAREFMVVHNAVLNEQKQKSAGADGSKAPDTVP